MDIRKSLTSITLPVIVGLALGIYAPSKANAKDVLEKSTSNETLYTRICNDNTEEDPQTRMRDVEKRIAIQIKERTNEIEELLPYNCSLKKSSLTEHVIYDKSNPDQICRAERTFFEIYCREK